MIDATPRAGKSHTICSVADLFPKIDGMLLAGMTAKVSFNRPGEFVRVAGKNSI